MKRSALQFARSNDMAVLTVSTDQLIKAVEQLPPEEQTRILLSLLLKRWPAWVEIVKYAEPKARAAAALRDKDWDALREDEREALIDDILHEGD